MSTAAVVFDKTFICGPIWMELVLFDVKLNSKTFFIHGKILKLSTYKKLKTY